MESVTIAALILRFGAPLVLFGSLLFWRLVPAEPPDPAGRLWLRRAAFISALATAIGAAVFLMATAGAGAALETSSKPLIAMIARTRLGEVTQAQFALLLIILWFAWRGGGGGQGLSAASATLVASLALVGHPSARGGPLLEVNQAIHLLAAASWVGGLPALAGRLVMQRSDPAASLRCLRRFSDYAWMAVVAVVITGAINAAVIANPLGEIATVPYGNALFAKLALVAAMIAIACANRFFLLPQSAKGLGRLRLLTIVELGLGVAVVAIACFLGTQSPPGE